jgi:NADPH:quinone reductase-like Zn-dependent oxidoreductase
MTTDLPTTMRAAHLTARGGPEVLVVRDDVAVPRPDAGEVLIRVAACGVNNTDVNTRVGWYSRSVTGATSGDGFDEAQADDSSWGGGLTFPRIQGADPCGEIVAVGEGVDVSRLGQRVVVDPWLRDRDDPADRSLAGYLGSERDGGFAEFCTVPAGNAHDVTRAGATDIELAGLACSWSTAFHMLERVRLVAGQRIAVTGASGGVGSALVRLATLRGAEVTAIAGRSKLEVVAAFGAHHLVERESDDVPATAAAAAGAPFDVVADIVGGPDFVGWLEALGKGGRYVTSGAIAGPIVDLDLRTLYLNDLELYGATVFDPQVFADLVSLVNAGDVVPTIAETYPLDDIHAAQAAFERKAHVGNIVITL